jgi:hypothetical protein
MRRLYTVAMGHDNDAYPLPPTKVYRGAFNQYPCTMTMDDLSTNEVTLVPGVYITSTRDCNMGTIRKTLHQLHDNFWDKLKLCGARKQIIASGYTARIVFCHWASSLYNGKLVSAFCQTACDTLIVTIKDAHIECGALNLKAFAAKNLLDILACVALANGLVSPNGLIGGACVEVTSMDIDKFNVLMTVQLDPHYMKEVERDETRLSSMYGHLVAEMQ